MFHTGPRFIQNPPGAHSRVRSRTLQDFSKIIQEFLLNSSKSPLCDFSSFGTLFFWEFPFPQSPPKVPSRVASAIPLHVFLFWNSSGIFPVFPSEINQELLVLSEICSEVSSVIFPRVPSELHPGTSSRIPQWLLWDSSRFLLFFCKSFQISSWNFFRFFHQRLSVILQFLL